MNLLAIRLSIVFGFTQKQEATTAKKKPVGPHKTPNKGTSAKSIAPYRLAEDISKSIWYGLNIQKYMEHATQGQKPKQSKNLMEHN